MEQLKRRPMFGPKPKSSVWNNMIKRDIKIKNLERARKIKAEKAKNKLKDKE